MAPHIRRATEADVSRLAEMLVFNNRLFYWPLFGDAGYSFGEMQVVPLAQSYRENPARLGATWVYEDGIIKGMAQLEDDELVKLYVEPAFQSEGVGAALLAFAVGQGAGRLWALEKNRRAVRFYAAHGFLPTGQRKFEEGTTEYLVELARA